METDLIGRLRSQYQGKRILVVGLGLQGGGFGVAKFFAKLGANVTISDLKSEDELKESIEKLRGLNVNYSLGGHKQEDFLIADVIFKGPLVLWDLPELVKAQEKGIPVEMEVSFFASICPGKIIGVTGTRGKSTTSAIIYDVLKKQGRGAYLAGNVSQTSTISLLNKMTKDDYVVLELSSWQLSGFHRKKISPHIAVFTNLYFDHLNFYRNLEEYSYDKKAVYMYQHEKDYLIANDELRTSIENDKPRSHVVYFRESDWHEPFEHLRGEHNQENAAAALATFKVLNLDLEKTKKDIASFAGLPYRQQKIREIDGTIFINDTTSTTPVATMKALKTFDDKPIILILGGNSKNLPFEELVNELEKALKIVLLEGNFTDQIQPLLKEKCPDKITEVYGDLKEAVLKARNLAKSGKSGAYVLFSPGATSFKMFKNEFDRGESFNKIVREL